MADTQPLAPTDAELLAEWDRVSHMRDAGERRLACLRAVLAKWGAQPVQAPPVGYTHASWLAAAKRGGGGQFSGRQVPGFDVPLYTAPLPVAREPLTDEQIYVLLETTGGDVYSLASANNVIDFARAIDFARTIEHAHGITKGNQ